MDVDVSVSMNSSKLDTASSTYSLPLAFENVTIWDVLIFSVTVIGAVSWTRLLYSRKPSSSLDFFYQVPQEKLLADGSQKRRVASRNVVERMRETGADMVIFWGSESGTAERFAHRLGNELELRFGIRVLVADLDGYDHKHLVSFESDKIAAFILSTYGEGDPPSNADAFWRMLAGFVDDRNNNNVRLDQLRYFVFGLGNRNYQHYNRVADVVDKSLHQLGARRIAPMGQADDSNGGTEEDFLSWKQEITESLCKTLNLEEQVMAYRPSINVSEMPCNEDDRHRVFLGEPHPSSLILAGRPDPAAPFILPVTEARELFSTDERTCLHMEFSLEHVPWVKYQTGDHLAVWPMNPDREVDRLLSLLGLKQKAHSTIAIAPRDGSSSAAYSTLPTATTIDALFRYYFEICAPLSRDILAGVAEFAPGEAERELLHQFVADRTKFETEVLSRHRTLASLLRSIGGEKTWQIPLSFLVERLRKMQPRRYSISSSAVMQPRRPSITVVVDTQNDAQDQGCYGLTTTYLLALQRFYKYPSTTTSLLTHTLSGPRNLLGDGDGAKAKIFGQIRRSTFKLPAKESTPVILIGAGTGIAPLRGFVQERARLQEIGKSVGQTILILGFRRSDEDFLYREEWSRHQSVLGKDRLKIWTAFSRQEPNNRVYVQDTLRDHADEILQILEQEDRSTVYICGSARMARDVVAELKRSWASWGQQPEEKADIWLNSLRRAARLHEDVWG